jgi:hypothetical protein
VIGLLTAEVPALPLHTAGKYVAAAFIVLFAIVLIYVAIMAIRLSRIERELGELLELADAREPEAQAQGPRQAHGRSEVRETTLAYPLEGQGAE